jgi:hypothetical protein
MPARSVCRSANYGTRHVPSTFGFSAAQIELSFWKEMVVESGKTP